MRLNLPRRNCIHFAILGEFTVSKDMDVEIQAFMEQTETRTIDLDGVETLVAFFGSKSRMGGATHSVRGRLERSVGENDLSLFNLWLDNEKAPDNLPRPPASVRPVSRLIEASSRWFGPIEISCFATFEYDETVYRSRVRFPLPMFVQSEGAGVTHVEQAQFSRRVNDEVEYSISVYEDSGVITHLVEFKDTIQLDSKATSQLLDRAHSISLQLVVRSERENDGHN